MIDITQSILEVQKATNAFVACNEKRVQTRSATSQPVSTGFPYQTLNSFSGLGEQDNTAFRWKFAQSHPVLTFVLITFAWTWLFWLAAIPFRAQSDLLVTAIVLIDVYGPAIGAILTLGLRNGLTVDRSRKKLLAMLAASVAIFALMALRYAIGSIPGYDRLPENLALSGPIVVTFVVVCLVGGWVISNAVSRNADIRETMASLSPARLPWRWTVFAVCFFPVLLLISWGIASSVGLGVEYPALWGRSIVALIPLFLLAFALTALARGGMEEPGWRGMMQPALQRRFSPLVAALIVAAVWSFWHLPLFLNGFYADPLVAGMVGGGIYRILLAIFLAWFYNRSGGNLLLLVILHTSFNVMVNYIPISEPILVALWVIVVVAIVLKDHMYRIIPIKEYDQHRPQA